MAAKGRVGLDLQTTTERQDDIISQDQKRFVRDIPGTSAHPVGVHLAVKVQGLSIGTLDTYYIRGSSNDPALKLVQNEHRAVHSYHTRPAAICSPTCTAQQQAVDVVLVP